MEKPNIVLQVLQPGRNKEVEEKLLAVVVQRLLELRP